MPYGPFGNLFPYADQHALNLDWIIQVAKDFLDQYTHIQDVISDGETSLDQHTTDGLEALAAEKDRLEGLLNAWYLTHSEDIAGELTTAISAFQTQAEQIAAEVIATIPGDYTALSTEVSTIRSDLSNTTSMFSDNSTLLSDHLSDGTGSHLDVDYTLSGNTLTAEGTSTGNSIYVLIATTSPVPSWIAPGRKYLIKVRTSGQFPSLTISIKTTENTSLHTLRKFTEAGEFILEMPSDATALRLASVNTNGTVLNGSITMEISRVLEVPFSNIVASAVTTLSSITKSGYYRIPSTSFASITDLPSQMTAQGGPADLFVQTYDEGSANILIQRTSGLMYTRENNNDNVGNWYQVGSPIQLKNYNSGDADGLTSNGWYSWGSTDSVTHVPGNASAGVLLNVIRELGTTAYQIGINYSNGKGYIRVQKAGTWQSWERILVASDIPTLGKVPKVMYEAGTFISGDADARISIYIPATTGYILYRLYHFVKEAIDCNCWQIYHVYKVSDSFSDQTDLTVGGEWECAIKLDGASQATGGQTHGYEYMDADSTGMLLDGVPCDPTSLTSRTSFTELKFYECSEMYDPDNPDTVIAYHGREYIFNEDGMTINQSLKMAVTDTLEFCYMAMFLPSKNYLDRAIFNNDFEMQTLASSTSDPTTTVTAPGATSTQMFDTTSGLSAEISVPIYPKGLTGGDTAKITDNAGSNYNKLYYIVCENAAVAANDVFMSQTVYKINNKT